MTKRLAGPNGETIIGTLERVFGTCGVELVPDDSEHCDIEFGDVRLVYDGSGTKIDWDSQTTVTRYGPLNGTAVGVHELIFLGEDGQEFKQSQLQVLDEPEEDE